MTDFDPQRVSQVDMAAILGVTDRTVRNLTLSGVLVEVDRGKYALHATVKAYVQYVERGRVASERSAKVSALDDERLRRLRIENDREEGRSVPVYEAQVVFNAAITEIASALDILPNRHSSELAMMNDAGKIKHKLKEIVRGIRENAARKIEGLADRANRRDAAAAAARPRARSVGGRKPRPAARKP